MADDVGSLAWGLETGGALSTGERLRLLGPVVKTTAAYAAGRLRLALGLRGRGGVDLEALRWPDTALVRAADEACRASASPVTVGHSWRTCAFGLALAQLDGVRVDVERLLAASLLHDVALETPTPRRCFAVVGALRALEVAQAAGADETTARAIADAVCIHVTPGIDVARHPLGAMVSAGAALDLLGMRLWELDPGFVARLEERHPRLQASRALSGFWRAEARAVPSGRAAFLDRVALFSLVMQTAPFRG